MITITHDEEGRETRFGDFDYFYTNTVDDVPVVLIADVNKDTAVIRIPGVLKYRVTVEIPKKEAFDLFHQASVMTYWELRDANHNFS